MTDDTTGEPEIEPGENHLTIRRTFDAPRERVWRAFTDPDELEQWFVPDGMTTEVRALEVEPGGDVAIIWHDGENRMDNEGSYDEVIEHERLVMVEEIDEGQLRVTYEFHDVDGGTEVVISQEFPGSVPEGANEGWSGILDNLEEVLAAT